MERSKALPRAPPTASPGRSGSLPTCPGPPTLITHSWEWALGVPENSQLSTPPQPGQLMSDQGTAAWPIKSC